MSVERVRVSANYASLLGQYIARQLRWVAPVDKKA